MNKPGIEKTTKDTLPEVGNTGGTGAHVYTLHKRRSGNLAQTSHPGPKKQQKTKQNTRASSCLRAYMHSRVKCSKGRKSDLTGNATARSHRSAALLPMLHNKRFKDISRRLPHALAPRLSAASIQMRPSPHPRSYKTYRTPAGVHREKVVG